MATLAEGKVSVRVRKKGGGPREILYGKDEPVSVENIFDWGKALFFPDGKNQHGLLSGGLFAIMLVCKTTEGKQWSLQEYLKSFDMFSSKLYIY